MLGSYPYWRVGQMTGFSGVEGLREGNIHFAGDATTWDFLGFMEGAVLSGERVAAEIEDRRTVGGWTRHQHPYACCSSG